MPAKQFEYKENENKIVKIKKKGMDHFNLQRVMDSNRFIFCAKKQLNNSRKFHKDSSLLSRKDKYYKLYKL